MDGDFDYSKLSRAQIEEALTRIDKGRFPLNNERLLKELQARPPEAPQVTPPPSTMVLIARYSASLAFAYIFLVGGWRLVSVLLSPRTDIFAAFRSPLVNSLIGIVAPLVVYVHLAGEHPNRFLRVASGVAFLVSFLDAALFYSPSNPRTSLLVFIGMLVGNCAVAAVVGNLRNVGRVEPPSNNRWRGP
jgi:hypothetical protein